MNYFYGFILGLIWGWIIVTCVIAIWSIRVYKVPPITAFTTAVKMWFRTL